MKSFFSKNKKKIIAISSIFLFASLFFLYPDVALAEDGKNVARVLGWIIWPFIFIMGQLATLLLGVLIKIAQYNDFINSAAVSYGWVVVRDLCNMFFVLILLIIAFASILRVDSYNLKTWLPKLVIMAVLINFSKLICGIFIDFAQVVMLTFVNAFKDIAGANLTDMLGISKILSFNESSTSEVTAWTIIGSMVLALIFSVIAVVVIVAMLAMLAMRIVLIWIYVVLSPIAYLMAAFPQGQSNSQRWWSDFSKNVIVGPVLAFFIWLAFASLGGVEGEAEIEKIRLGEAREKSGLGDENSTKASDQLLTEAGSEGNLIKMIISIGMLLGGLMLAQEMGDRSGKIAGKGLAKLQTMGAGSLKLGKRAVGIERAQNAVKAYQQRKESTRSDLATRDAGRLLTAEGKVKQGVAYLPNQVAKGTSNLVKRSVGLNDAKLREESESIDNRENELSDIKKDNYIQNSVGKVDKLRKERDDTENDYNARIATASLSGNFDEVTKLEGERDSKIDDFNEAISSEQNSLIENYEKATGNTAVFDDLEADAENKDKEFNKVKDPLVKEKEDKLVEDRTRLAENKKSAEYIDKGVGAVVGTALGGVIGSAFGAPLIGAISGGVGGWKTKDKLNNAGQKSLNLASNYNSDIIGKAKESMKENSVDDLRKTSNDYSKTTHERTAASMILMERGELSQSEARVKKEEISSSFKGDNKVINQLDSALMSNYQSISKAFTDLKTTSEPPRDENGKLKVESISEKSKREREHEDAREKIVRGIVSGSIKIDNINDQDALDMLLPKLANTISSTNLTNIYKAQTSKKQDMMEKSLKVSIASNPKDSKSASALVGFTGSMDNLDNEDQKTKYLEGVNKVQLNDLIDTSKGFDSLMNWMQTNSANILASIRTHQNDPEKVAEIINKITKKSQYNTNNSKDNSYIKKIIQGLRNRGLL